MLVMNMEDEIIKSRAIPYPYKTDPDEMVARFEKCYCAALYDVLSEMGYDDQWLGPEITCRTKELKRDAVAGFAFTVQFTSGREPIERGAHLAAIMIDSYFKNAVICIDTGHDMRSGYLGELNTNAFLRNGVRASVIDGGVKDSGFIKLMDYPVFSRFASPINAFDRNRLRGWQLPIYINDVMIEPMDIIMSDSDGVTVIPKAIAEEVLEGVEHRKKQEDDTRDLIKSGMSAEQVAIKMGYKYL